MKALIFVDLHDDHLFFQELKSKSKEADVILGAGDYSMFARNLDRILAEINNLGKPCFLIHGNHEYHEEMVNASKNLKNITIVHKTSVSFKNIKIAGYGGDGFSRRDSTFEKIMTPLIDDQTILLLHGPPSNTEVDKTHGMHVGNESYTKVIKEKKPLLVVCGHIHETAGKMDKIKNTIIINPGPAGLIVEVN